MKYFSWQTLKLHADFLIMEWCDDSYKILNCLYIHHHHFKNFKKYSVVTGNIYKIVLQEYSVIELLTLAMQCFYTH